MVVVHVDLSYKTATVIVPAPEGVFRPGCLKHSSQHNEALQQFCLDWTVCS